MNPFFSHGNTRKHTEKTKEKAEKTVFATNPIKNTKRKANRG